VPIRQGERILGDLYLTDKDGADEFSEADQALLEVLAEHAALAIVNTQLRGRLQRSEERYRVLTESAPEIVFAIDEVGQITFINDRVRSVTGFEPEWFVGRSLRQVVVPEDRPLVDIHLQAVRYGTPRTTFQVRAMDTHGFLRHYEVSLAPRAGREQGFQGIAQDVTERHALAREMAERTTELVHTREEREHLRSFVSLIIQAQEEERARIAGDLHDTTVQTLTAIARRLHTLAASPATDPGELVSELGLLAQAAQVEADEVRRLSRNLRPSVLDHLGLAAGLEQLSADMRQQGYVVNLAVSGNASHLSDHARTALFRIAQEALTNIRRHSGASQVAIRLDVGPAVAVLVIHDDGRGFDAAAVAGKSKQSSSSLGLEGMRERAAILGVTVDIRSVLGQGTWVEAYMPLA
jgi:PAS domain S-box-containing protein